jgi:hypothetical protein
MISDCDKRSSIKSLRSASLVSSLFESATSIIHPLERFEPNVEIEIDSPGTPERRSLFDTEQLSHVGRSASSRSTEVKKSVQLKR